MKKTAITIAILSLAAVSAFVLLKQAPATLSEQTEVPPTYITEAINVDKNSSEKPMAEEAEDPILLAKKAYAAEKYDVVLPLITPLVEEGNTQAIYILAHMYNEGNGVAVDKAKAAKYYQAVIDKNVASAKYYLGILYFSGEGVAQSNDKAAELFEPLALNGHLKSQAALAPIYAERADNGNPIAQYKLAVMYQNSQGVDQDLDAAFKLYQKSAEQGNTQAENNLGIMYRDGLGTKTNDELAYKWFNQSANKGYANAQVNLGLMHKTGRGVAQNYSSAIKLFELADKQNYHAAAYNFGLLYERGEGVKQSYKQAINWYIKAVKLHSSPATYQLATLYRDGLGVEKNTSFALTYFTIAAEANNIRSLNAIGDIYKQGLLGEEKDATLAYLYYIKAAKLNSNEGKFNAANMLITGEGVTKNTEQALTYLKEAAEDGYEPAQLKLEQLNSKN